MDYAGGVKCVNRSADNFLDTERIQRFKRNGYPRWEAENPPAPSFRAAQRTRNPERLRRPHSHRRRMTGKVGDLDPCVLIVLLR